jgi:hypothetical protein
MTRLGKNSEFTGGECGRIVANDLFLVLFHKNTHDRQDIIVSKNKATTEIRRRVHLLLDVQNEQVFRNLLERSKRNNSDSESTTGFWHCLMRKVCFVSHPMRPAMCFSNVDLPVHHTTNQRQHLAANTNEPNKRRSHSLLTLSLSADQRAVPQPFGPARPYRTPNASVSDVSLSRFLPKESSTNRIE